MAGKVKILFVLFFSLFFFLAPASFGSDYGPNSCAYWLVRLEEISVWERELILAKEEKDEKLIQYFKLKIWKAMEDISNEK
jgi:hypothetical protein